MAAWLVDTTTFNGPVREFLTPRKRGRKSAHFSTVTEAPFNALGEIDSAATPDGGIDIKRGDEETVVSDAALDFAVPPDGD